MQIQSVGGKRQMGALEEKEPQREKGEQRRVKGQQHTQEKREM